MLLTEARSHSALRERRYAPLTALVALRAARRAFSGTTAYKDFSQRRLNAPWRTEPLSTAPKVEPVSTLGAVESGSVRHRALCGLMLQCALCHAELKGYLPAYQGANWWRGETSINPSVNRWAARLREEKARLPVGAIRAVR